MTAAALAESYSTEIRKRAGETEAARRMPADLAQRMAEAGLFRLLVPRQYGGLQVHPQVPRRPPLDLQRRERPAQRR